MTAARELEQVADWLPLLHLMRTSRPPQAQVGPRPAPGSRPPLNVDAVDLIERVHATLASWVQLAMEEGLTSDDWPADNTLAVCLWLARNAHLMDEHMAGDEFAAEVHDLWKRVRNAVGERPPRRPRCIRVLDGQHCGHVLDCMDEGGEASDVPEEWRWCACPGCGMTYTFDAELRRLGKLQGLTLAEWAAELGIRSTTLRMRLERGKVRPDVLDAKGRKLYFEDTRKKAQDERIAAL